MQNLIHAMLATYLIDLPQRSFQDENEDGLMDLFSFLLMFFGVSLCFVFLCVLRFFWFCVFCCFFAWFLFLFCLLVSFNDHPLQKHPSLKCF